MPPNDIQEQILLRFDRVEDKIDDLRRELMASFVLKQVFDSAIEARDKRLQILEDAEKERSLRELTQFQRWLVISGGILGLITAVLNLFHFKIG